MSENRHSSRRHRRTEDGTPAVDKKPPHTRCWSNPIEAFVLFARPVASTSTVTNGIAAQIVDVIQLPRLRYPP